MFFPLVKLLKQWLNVFVCITVVLVFVSAISALVWPSAELNFWQNWADSAFAIFGFAAILGLIGLGLKAMPPEGANRERTAGNNAAMEEEKIGERKAEEQESVGEQKDYEDKWYVRYPVAIFLLCATYVVYSEKDDFWWLAIVSVLVAAIFAREVSLVLLAALIIYLIGQGVAALPVSLAIVIGALIIAASLKK